MDGLCGGAPYGIPLIHVRLRVRHGMEDHRVAARIFYSTITEKINVNRRPDPAVQQHRQHHRRRDRRNCRTRHQQVC